MSAVNKIRKILISNSMGWAITLTNNAKKYIIK